MRVNFTKVKAEVTLGEYRGMDIAKTVGNATHQNTSDIGVDETARNIYHSEGELKIPDEQISVIIYALSNTSTTLVSTKKVALSLLKLTQE